LVGRTKLKELADAREQLSGINKSLAELEERRNRTAAAAGAGSAAGTGGGGTPIATDPRIQGLIDSVRTPAEEFIDLIQQLQKDQQALGETAFNRLVLKAAEDLEKAITVTEKLTDAQVFAAKVIEDLKGPEERRLELLTKLNEAVAEGALTQDQATEALMKYDEQLRDTLTDQEKLEALFKNVSELIGEDIANGFIAASIEGNNFLEVLQNITEAILKMVLQQAILEPLAGAITTGLKGFNPFKSRGTVTAGNIPGTATGGPAGANIPRIVGERGAELLVPNAASTVINSSRLRSLGGGGNISIQFTNKGTPQTATGVQQVPTIDGMIINVITDDLRRGGILTNAFRQRFTLSTRR
jgi:hypothetical protein